MPSARPAFLALALIAAPVSAADAQLIPADYRADAAEVDALVAANYAYLDDLPGGTVPASPALATARDAVHDADSLLRYAQDRITTLADHHALTARSFRDDWAIVPTYADLWIALRDGAYVVDAVKPDSPAARAGIRSGDRLSAIDAIPTATAVTAFWSRLGLDPVGERAPFAARILAAGRRDRPRRLTIDRVGRTRTLTLPSLYADQPERAPLTVSSLPDGRPLIRLNNALGDTATIAAFDSAMAAIPPDGPLVIDLTDTPSGGTTTVARAMLGWFVDRPMPYQMHRLPAEERETGIPRQWIEQVLPRSGKYHPGPLEVRVGRWTGSVGEGIAIGFQAIGRPVCGGDMAALKGAVYDFALSKSGLVIKFPAERLSTIAGDPREKVRLSPCKS